MRRVRCVDGGDALADRVEDAQDVLGRDRRAAVARTPRVQCLRWEVLHDDVRRARVVAEREDLDDVLVVDAGHRPRLVDEPPLVVRAVGPDDLDGDLAVEALVAREQHEAHAALAEGAQDAVGSVQQ